MKTTSRNYSIRSLRPSSMLITALTSALVFGCAATDDEESSDEGAEKNGPADIAAAVADPLPEGNGASADDTTSTDKALRRDFCCAEKSGNYVEQCVNMYVTKAGGVLRCSAGDNVLRDGRCNKYESCNGKTWNPL